MTCNICILQCWKKTFKIKKLYRQYINKQIFVGCDNFYDGLVCWPQTLSGKERWTEGSDKEEINLNMEFPNMKGLFGHFPKGY